MAKTIKCRRCDGDMTEGKMQCPSCRAWQFNYLSDATGAGNDGTDGTVTLDAVTSSELDRLQTGKWDKVWGANEKDDGTKVYGITKGSTTLIGGSPGAGKSTLMLEIGAVVAAAHSKPKHEVLYIASEEQLKQIKQRATRLRIGTDIMQLMRMVPAMTGGVNLNSLLNRYKPPLMILDSLKGMVGENDEEAMEVCKIFKQFCMAYDCPGIIATHVTKDEVIAGKLSIQHEVDTTMTFFPDAEFQTFNNETMRVLESTKNRNGQAFQRVNLAMTETGLIVIDAENAADLIIGLEKEDYLDLGLGEPPKKGKKSGSKPKTVSPGSGARRNATNVPTSANVKSVDANKSRRNVQTGGR